MTSLFDYQFNCQPEPEKTLIWTFLTIELDPLVPGMVEAVYNLAWAGTGGVGGEREKAFRASFALSNVRIDPVDFVITGVGPWFQAWAASISEGTSVPFDACPSLSF